MGPDELLGKIKTHEDDPNELSKILLEISALMFRAGSDLADKQLEYADAIISILDNPARKVSVAEAERVADVKTECNHDRAKYFKDALLELLNSIKARLRVLESEREKSNTN